jgi:hypothetical protein
MGLLIPEYYFYSRGTHGESESIESKNYAEARRRIVCHTGIGRHGRDGRQGMRALRAWLSTLVDSPYVPVQLDWLPAFSAHAKVEEFHAD